MHPQALIHTEDHVDHQPRNARKGIIIVVVFLVLMGTTAMIHAQKSHSVEVANRLHQKVSRPRTENHAADANPTTTTLPPLVRRDGTQNLFEWSRTFGNTGGGSHFHLEHHSQVIIKFCTHIVNNVIGRVRVQFADGTERSTGTGQHVEVCQGTYKNLPVSHQDMSWATEFSCVTDAYVQSGNVVDHISFHYTRYGPGAFEWPAFGGPGGGETVIRAGRYCLCGVAGTSGWLLDSVRFKFCPRPLDVLPPAMLKKDPFPKGIVNVAPANGDGFEDDSSGHTRSKTIAVRSNAGRSYIGYHHSGHWWSSFYGGNGGWYFKLEKPGHYIKHLCLSHNGQAGHLEVGMISGIRVTYTDSTPSHQVGTKQNELCPMTFMPFTDETWKWCTTDIRIRTGAHVDRIEISINWFREHGWSAPFGGSGGHNRNYVHGAPYCLCGVQGYVGSLINKISFKFCYYNYAGLG